MKQLATITSKRQLTIPVGIFDKLAFEEGERVMVSEVRGKMVVQSAKDLVGELAGSISLPKRFRGLSIEEIAQKAKKEYFKKRK